MEDLIKNRHSVRRYLSKEIEKDIVIKLNEYIDELNKNDLNFKLVLNKNIFKNLFLGYGFIKNCNNYVILSGKEDSTLEERIGYYGEKLVLKAQELGLNTCFVGGTYKKKRVTEDIGNNKMILVLAIGYGENQGKVAKTKKFEDVSLSKDVPEWYKLGIEYVLMAPSAVNQKKWKFEYLGDNKVKIVSEKGYFPKVDMGIAKLHFELGANINIEWVK